MPQIIVYDNKDMGARLLCEQLQAMTDFDVRIKTAKHIFNGELENDTVGLVMPGRTSGQLYRDELGDDGFKKIQAATQNGMAVLAICAGSYILSRQAQWKNNLSGEEKFVQSPYPLFNGKAFGPLHHLWRDGYESSGTRVTTKLAANVVQIKFNGTGNTCYTVYWGGASHEPDAGQDIAVMAYHQNLSKTPAVIHFACGQGKVIFSNIHPEVTPQAFTEVFGNTDKAKQHPVLFQQDKRFLTETAATRNLIFEKFIENCQMQATKTVALKNTP